MLCGISIPVHQSPVPRSMSVVSQELHRYVVLDFVEKSYTVQVPQVLIMVLVSLAYLRRI